jgi:tripartite-type tricarboxylate transporter receptor subunit TctC
MARKPLQDKSSTRRRYLKQAGVVSAIGISGLAGCTGNGGNGNGNGGNGNGDGGNGNGDGGNGNGDGGNGNGDGGWEPEQNVRLIVPWGAGGGTDTAVRQVAQPTAEILSDRGIDIELNVENVTGAGGLNGAQAALDQPADGYTIFADTNVVAPNIAQGNAPFTLDDWAGIARMQYDTSFIITSGTQDDYPDLETFVDYASENEFLFGITGGLDSAVFPVEFAQAAGILDNMELVAYDDAGQMENDVITSEIDVAFGELVEVAPLVDEGEMRLLFAGLDQPVRDFEDVPTIESTGYDASFGVQRALVVQDGTPQEAIDFWAEIVEEAMSTDSYQEFETANYLDLREGYLPGPEHIDNLADMVDLFEQTMEVYQA